MGGPISDRGNPTSGEGKPNSSDEHTHIGRCIDLSRSVKKSISDPGNPTSDPGHPIWAMGEK